MKTSWLVVLVVLCWCAGFAAQPVQLPGPAPPVDEGLQDLERNVALAAGLGELRRAMSEDWLSRTWREAT